MLFHHSVPRELPEAEAVFETAVELAFSLHYDPTLAARRIAAHPAGEYKQLYQLVQDLVFGPADRCDDLLASMDELLDTVPGEVLDVALWHSGTE